MTMQIREESMLRLYETVQANDEPATLVENVLELGATHLGVDNGHLTWIDTEHGHWEALVSTNETVPPGLTLPLETTYCRRALDRGGPVVIHNARAEGWECDPAYRTHGFACYFGTPIRIGELTGTVCFVAEDDRSEFSQVERVFGELTARVLEQELRQQQAERQLAQRRRLTGVLSRVLRHNLRNDMTVVQGYTDLVQSQLDDEDLASRLTVVDDRIEELIQLGEKAQELETIVETDDTHQQRNVPAILDAIIESVAHGSPATTIVREGPDEATVPAMANIQRAFRELIENAVNHGPNDGTVTVTVEPSTSELAVYIDDEGPGLPDQERTILDRGVETPLSHGSGLGLQIVAWIVDNHEGSVTVEDTADGTRVGVHLPTSATSVWGSAQSFLPLR